MERTTFKFIGGPLDGQTALTPRRGKDPSFRRDNGEKMPTGEGDRIFIYGAKKRHGYCLAEVEGGRAYIHATLT